MKQLPEVARKKSVGVQIVLFKIQLRIAAIEIARVITPDPLTQNQVLSPRRRSNRIGLHESQSCNRGLPLFPNLSKLQVADCSVNRMTRLPSPI